MRGLLFEALTTDPMLIGLGITDDSSFASDVDTPQNRPFLQLRWGRTDEGLAAVKVRSLVVWVHDKGGDYSTIDSILLRLRSLIPSLVGESNGPGWLVDVTWNGDSEDLTDDGHKTITRNASFTLVGSGQ
jgi:hypothetical protein